MNFRHLPNSRPFTRRRVPAGFGGGFGSLALGGLLAAESADLSRVDAEFDGFAGDS